MNFLSFGTTHIAIDYNDCNKLVKQLKPPFYPTQGNSDLVYFILINKAFPATKAICSDSKMFHRPRNCLPSLYASNVATSPSGHLCFGSV